MIRTSSTIILVIFFSIVDFCIAYCSFVTDYSYKHFSHFFCFLYCSLKEFDTVFGTKPVLPLDSTVIITNVNHSPPGAPKTLALSAHHTKSTNWGGRGGGDIPQKARESVEQKKKFQFQNWNVWRKKCKGWKDFGTCSREVLRSNRLACFPITGSETIQKENSKVLNQNVQQSTHYFSVIRGGFFVKGTTWMINIPGFLFA